MNIWVGEVEGTALVFDPAMQLPECPHLFLWDPSKKTMGKYIAPAIRERIRPHADPVAVRKHIDSYQAWFLAAGHAWLENEKPYYAQRRQWDEEKRQASLAEEARKAEASRVAREKELERLAAVESFLETYRPRCFYHFTDVRNIASIVNSGGLWSMQFLRANGIHVPAPGGDEKSQDSDQRKGMDQYVHLCLFDQNPMEYRARQDGRIGQSRFLEVDREILRVEGVRFTPAMANQTGVMPLTLEQAVTRMDFAAVYERLNVSLEEQRQRILAARKYELLVPNHVPARYIKGL